MKRPNITVDYCITRTGIINLPKSLSSSNQCAKIGHSKYYYTCKVFTNNKKLDNQGFIVDHNDLDKAINTELKKNKFKGSCELMSEALISVVMNIMKKKGKDFKSIEITIKANKLNNPAFITASYNSK